MWQAYKDSKDMTDKEREIELAYKELYALWEANATPELDAEYKRQEDLAYSALEESEFNAMQDALEELENKRQEEISEQADRALKERRKNHRLIDMSGDDSSINPAFE